MTLNYFQPNGIWVRYSHNTKSSKAKMSYCILLYIAFEIFKFSQSKEKRELLKRVIKSLMLLILYLHIIKLNHELYHCMLALSLKICMFLNARICFQLKFWYNLCTNDTPFPLVMGMGCSVADSFKVMP